MIATICFQSHLRSFISLISSRGWYKPPLFFLKKTLDKYTLWGYNVCGGDEMAKASVKNSKLEKNEFIHKYKKRTETEKSKLTARLKRIEGQVRGIIKMVENDAYCPAILIQVLAVNNALNSFNKELLSCHIRNCVKADIENGDDRAVEEFVKMINKLMK